MINVRLLVGTLFITCHLIIILIISSLVYFASFGYLAWSQVTNVGSLLLPQAASAKARFAPPSALKGTCALWAPDIGAPNALPYTASAKARFAPPSALKGTCVLWAPDIGAPNPLPCAASAKARFAPPSALKGTCVLWAPVTTKKTLKFSFYSIHCHK